MPAKISKQEKVRIIHISSMAIVCLLSLLLVYLPKIKKMNSYTKEIKQISVVVNKLSEINNNPSEFKNKKDRIRGSLDIIQEKVPLKPMIPQVVEQITRPVKELGLNLVSITPLESVKKGSAAEETMGIEEEFTERSAPTGIEEETAESGGYMETPIELFLQGEYKQFGLYLDRIRHLPRLIIVKEFEIKKNKDIEPNLDIKLKISVFYYGKE